MPRLIQYAKAYAYSIQVTKSWNVQEEVYEAVFDSYSMDWNTFMAQMNVRLNQYNENGDHRDIENASELNDYIATHPTESNYTYYIGYDNRNYYQASNARLSASHAMMEVPWVRAAPPISAVTVGVVPAAIPRSVPCTQRLQVHLR